MSDADVLAAIARSEARVMARLDAMARRLDAIEAVLVRRRRGLSRADAAVLGRLLPAIAGAIGSAEFLACEIIGHDAPGLRIATADLSVRQLGRLLRRATGHAVTGYVVERLDEEAGAVIWRVVACP